MSDRAFSRRSFALLGGAAVLYGIQGCSAKPGDLKAYAKGELIKLEVPNELVPAPDIPILGPDGQALKLASFKGKVLVVNFWAQWCAPCKTELPSLGRLAQAYAGKDVAVIAITVDKDKDIAKAQAVLATAPPLVLYRDPGYQLTFAMPPRTGFSRSKPAESLAPVFPTTSIFDRQGRERARLPADADWASADAKALVDAVLALA